MKIKNCAKCGGIARLNDYPETPMVYCIKCGEEGATWALRREAARAWNQAQAEVEKEKEIGK